MQPSSSMGAGRNRQLRRWGPIAGVIVLVAVVVVVVVATKGSNNGSSSPTTTLPASTTSAAAATSSVAPSGSTTPGSSSTPPTSASPKVTYPLSFAQATTEGLAGSIDWGKRCDTARGKLAVPDFFAQPCFAPFTGDNGGATAPGVTGDQITIVYYEGQAADPIVNYITDAVHVDDTNGDRFATMKELIRYYETYYELYGRKINLVTFEGTGNATDEVAARRCGPDRPAVQAVRGVRRAHPHQRVRR